MCIHRWHGQPPIVRAATYNIPHNTRRLQTNMARRQKSVIGESMPFFAKVFNRGARAANLAGAMATLVGSENFRRGNFMGPPRSRDEWRARKVVGRELMNALDLENAALRRVQRGKGKKRRRKRGRRRRQTRAP